ncbi:hypothetical protein VNO77_03969 [Canavalia gladiata]|uniref:Uncharacterized protein n=1 Tax=Canavalia gladiata TaxID=3824 RepID=A0AAN9R4E2_CANGL
MFPYTSLFHCFRRFAANLEAGRCSILSYGDSVGDDVNSFWSMATAKIGMGNGLIATSDWSALWQFSHALRIMPQ